MIILPGSLHYGASQIIPQVMQGINQSLIQNGHNLMIANLDRDETSERHILNLAFGGTVRGAIILSSKLPEAGGRSLAEAGLPIVSLLFDMSEASVPSVVTNDRGRDAGRRPDADRARPSTHFLYRRAKRQLSRHRTIQERPESRLSSGPIRLLPSPLALIDPRMGEKPMLDRGVGQFAGQRPGQSRQGCPASGYPARCRVQRRAPPRSRGWLFRFRQPGAFVVIVSWSAFSSPASKSPRYGEAGCQSC